MISEWQLAAFTLPVALLLAAWAHELTHAVVAWALGAVSVRVNLLRLEVEYEMPETAADWRARAIGFAPLGLWVGIVAGLAGVGWRPQRWLDVPVVAGLFWFAVGSMRDYVVVAAQGDDWIGRRLRLWIDSHEDWQIDGAAALLLALWSIPWHQAFRFFDPGRGGWVVWTMGQGFLAGAFLLGLRAFYVHEKRVGNW